MCLLKSIRTHIREYRKVYDRLPTHITLNPDEAQRLQNETGFVGSVHGQKVEGVEIRVFDHTPDGVHFLSPSRGVQ